MGLFSLVPTTDRKLFLTAMRSPDRQAAVVKGWSCALELRDKETEGHARRVAAATVSLARAMGVDVQTRHYLHWGALLHDIGKIGVPDRILHKPGPLDPDEWEVMRRHPEHAYAILAPIAFLTPALDIPYCHHERWDGTGYPRGLAGEAIPLGARIFSVVDVWDALRSPRPYRTEWDEPRVLAEIEAGAGSHFDPRVVDTFLELRQRVSDRRPPRAA
jgi:HD-GYP domain-containing protein (c-di-GMP phosphodiesterase class II)